MCGEDHIHRGSEVPQDNDGVPVCKTLRTRDASSKSMRH